MRIFNFGRTTKKENDDEQKIFGIKENVALDRCT